MGRITLPFHQGHMQIIISTVVIRHSDNRGTSTRETEEDWATLCKRRKLIQSDARGLISRQRISSPCNSKDKRPLLQKDIYTWDYTNVQHLSCLPFKFVWISTFTSKSQLVCAGIQKENREVCLCSSQMPFLIYLLSLESWASNSSRMSESLIKIRTGINF